MCGKLKLSSTEKTTCKIEDDDCTFQSKKGGFKLQTKQELKKDKILYGIYDNSVTGAEYILPTRPVDGTYKGCTVCKDGDNVI